MKDLYLKIRHHSKSDNIVALNTIGLLSILNIILLFY